MARPKKNAEMLHCMIEKELCDKLKIICEETGLTKTTAVERALKVYIALYEKCGQS